MAIPDPTNCWTSSEAAIANAIANSATFWSLTETTNAEDAAGLVFGEQLGQPLNGNHYSTEELQEHYRYYAQVYSAPENPYGKRRLSSRHYFPFGSAVIFIERLVREVERESAEVPLEIERRFKNTVGDIIDDVLNYLETNGGPQITSLLVEEGPGVNARERWPKEGMWQGVVLIATWGLEQ